MVIYGALITKCEKQKRIVFCVLVLFYFVLDQTKNMAYRRHSIYLRRQIT
jgi:hypothetical protein